MSIPAEMTTLDISGTFIMNKTLSDSTDDILALQGVGWLTRKAISLATITLNVKHFKDAEENNAERITIVQTLTGGISGTTESRLLVWKPNEYEDHIFGPVISRSRRVTNLGDLDVEFLKKDWSPDTLEHGLIHTRAESDTPKSGRMWIAEQTWGFQDIKGEKRYTRHLKFTGPGSEDLERTLVYDYVSAA